MAKPCTSILAAFVLTLTLAANAEGKLPAGPETVEVRNGSVTLHALLWRPQGRGPFPAILLNHGSGRTPWATAKQQRKPILHRSVSPRLDLRIQDGMSRGIGVTGIGMQGR